MKPPSTPAVETGIVDVIEEPASGAIVVTEAEATEVREPSAGPSSRRVETNRKNHKVRRDQAIPLTRAT